MYFYKNIYKTCANVYFIISEFHCKKLRFKHYESNKINISLKLYIKHQETYFVAF